MPTPTSIKTICCYCGVGCGIEVSRDARGKLSLRGDPDHPTNRGLLCSKGRTLLHVVAARDERLRTPQVRLDRSQPLGRTGWDQALGHVAATFKRIIAEHGPDAVGFYCSGQMLTEEYYIVNKLVKGYLGTNNMDTNSRLCMSSAVAGYKQTLGADGPPIAYEDIESCDTFLVTGANPAWCHPILWRRVEARKAADPAVRIIIVDPRETASCAGADLHLKLRPGTDVALHHGLARRLWETGAIDEAFIADHTEGWAGLQAAFAPWTLERTAAECGLAAGDIAQAAAWLAGGRRFLSLWTMGLNQSSVGVDKNATLINLSLITGKIGRPGCGPFSLTGQPNAMGGREVGGLANLASAHRDLADPAHRAEIAAHWGVPSVPEKPGLSALEMFAALREGRMKAVWIIATNPIESLPDAWGAEAALRAAELVVVQDCYPTATTQFADVVLPAATWLEKAGTMTNSERRIGLLQPLVEPPGEALADSRIIARFAAAMGWEASFAYAEEAAIFAEHAALTRGRDCDISGLSHESLRLDGTRQWPAPALHAPEVPRLYTDHRFQTPSGRARLRAPPVMTRSEPLSAAHPLILTTGRLRDQWHTMTKTGRVGKLRDHADAPFCEIHPDDAGPRGIRSGDIVVVAGARGEVQVRAEVTTTIRPGVVFLPMHWGRQRGGERGRANNLTSPIYDPVSKEPDLKFSAVEVRRHTPPAREILIVGGGAAAWGFIAAHRRHGLADRITVFGDEPLPIYDRVLLPHYVSGHSSWESMVKGGPAELAAQGVVFKPGVRIERIERKTQEIVDAGGGRHRYDVLILATGSRPARHYQGPLPAHGVFGLRKRSDAEAIRALAGPGRSAVIIGGGVLGIELADALRSLGTRVTVLQRSDRLMGRSLDARAAGLLAEHLTGRGIGVRFRAEVEELQGGAQVSGVKLKDGTVLPCQLVVFATGTAPNAELARAAVLDCSTGVKVDAHLRTSDPAIFAIGEVADFDSQAAGTTAAAEEQAVALAEFLRGNLHAGYRGPVNANILKVEGVQLAAIGVVDADQPGTSAVVFDDPDGGVYQKCVIKDDRLIGVIMMGDTALFADYRDLVASGSELEERRATLLRPAGEVRRVEGRLVCSCNQVGEETIARSVRAQSAAGACELQAVCAATRAGTSCGSCRPEVRKLMQAHAAPAAAGAPA
jgi:ferredoxin-nitrate reductase